MVEISQIHLWKEKTRERDTVNADVVVVATPNKRQRHIYGSSVDLRKETELVFGERGLNIFDPISDVVRSWILAPQPAKCEEDYKQNRPVHRKGIAQHAAVVVRGCLLGGIRRVVRL